jgi:hypothetical protein
MTDHTDPVAVDLDELERLAADATSGTWTWDQYRVPTLGSKVYVAELDYYRDVEVVAAEHDGECGCRSDCVLELNITDADKAFIAGTNPEVVAALIARIRELEAR